MTLKIEAGKSYKARNGARVEIVMRIPNGNENNCWLGYVDYKGNNIGFSWKEDGAYPNAGIPNHPFDVVGEWREPRKVERWAVFRSGCQIYSYYLEKQEALDSLKKVHTFDEGAFVVYLSGTEGVEP